MDKDEFRKYGEEREGKVRRATGERGDRITCAYK